MVERWGLLCSPRKGRRGAPLILRIFSALGVFFVAMLVLFLYWVFVMRFLGSPQIATFYGSALILTPLVAVFHVVVVLLIWAYFRVVATDPGEVTAEMSAALAHIPPLVTTDASHAEFLRDGTEEDEDDDGDEELTNGAEMIPLRIEAARVPGPPDGIAGVEEGSLPGPSIRRPDSNRTSVASSALWLPQALRITHCRKCLGPRPPRAHHCAICHKCGESADTRTNDGPF